MRITCKAVTVDGSVSLGGLFWGYSISGDAAEGALFKAGDTNGRILATVVLTAEKLSESFCLPFGVPAEGGVFVDVIGTPTTVVTYYSA